MRLRAIVYATDFSEASRAALAAAVELTRKFEARLTILHVAQGRVDVVPVVAGVPPVEIGSRPEEARGSALRRLEQWSAENVPEGQPVTLDVAEGDPAEEIVEFAASQGADILVLGTQGHSALERFFLGSVAEAVLRRAPCPILAVPYRVAGEEPRGAAEEDRPGHTD